MKNKSADDIKNFLEILYKKYNKTEYVKSDPIRFPHELNGNKEFIAFTAACFAYGNMKAIQGFLFKYFGYAGLDPLNLECKEDKGLYYRFQTSADVAAYSTLMKKVYLEYGSLETLFKKAGALNIEKAGLGIELLRSYGVMTNGMNFLMPIPGKSASKRLYMFLRWVSRRDEIDFGLWKSFDKVSLYMPVDTHILRMAKNMGIINKNENDKKAVIKVTDFFKSLNPDDPAKYDFALTRLGIAESCRYELNENCNLCSNKEWCIF